MLLKFKAWDKKRKRLAKVIAINLYLKQIVLKDITVPFEDAEIIESTGLKDKNGTEIYEGDILLNTASENQEDWKKWRVHYADGRFLIDYKQIPKDKRKRKNLELEDLCEDNVWIYGLEVIGNIYENPELLEVEDD